MLTLKQFWDTICVGLYDYNTRPCNLRKIWLCTQDSTGSWYVYLAGEYGNEYLSCIKGYEFFDQLNEINLLKDFDKYS